MDVEFQYVGRSVNGFTDSLAKGRAIGKSFACAWG